MTNLSLPSGALPPGIEAAWAGVPEADEALLTEAERARRVTFGSADRRLQFTLGRTVARRLAGRRLGVPPVEVPLRLGADGAPEVEGLCVSIAHGGRGGEAVAAAAVADGPVGVDVEAIVPRQEDLWDRILAPEEVGVRDALGGHSTEALTLVWSLKEAVLKGQRTGLRAGARSVRLVLDADGVSEAGTASAVSARSGSWLLRFCRLGGVWVTVAWPDAVPGR